MVGMKELMKAENLDNLRAEMTVVE